MNVTVLIDDTLKMLNTEHGMSLVVKTNDLTFMVDFGSSDLWKVNAQKLGIEINVDFAVCSHNHNDHNGGIWAFKEMFSDKPIYMGIGTNMTYGGKYFPHYKLGINKLFFNKYQDSLVLVKDMQKVADNVYIVNVPYKRKEVSGKYQYIQRGSVLYADKYKHEVCVCVIENQTLYIISPCSHKGVVNIIENCLSRFEDVTQVIFVGGLHTVGRDGEALNCSKEHMNNIAERIAKLPVEHMFLGHCTGDKAIDVLRANGVSVLQICDISGVNI